MRFVKMLMLLLFMASWLPAPKGQACPEQHTPQDRPRTCCWRKKENRNDILQAQKFAEWLIGGCKTTDTRCPAPAYKHVEYEGYDGWYNNMGRPSQGAVDTPLQRLLPPAYGDGVYEPTKRKINPLLVSQNLMDGAGGLYSKGGKTAFLVFFGQQVVEEILDAQRAGCPPEYFNIDIYKEHEYRKDEPHLTQLPLLRTRYDMRTGFSPNNPRQQLNEITPYLDGGLIYGVAKGWADVLRLFANDTIAPHGKLAWHDELGEGFPAQNTQRLPMANPPPPTNHSEFTKRSYTAPVERFFKLGNPRGNENPFLLTFGIMWFRWHNYIADYLHNKHEDWSSERIFNEARKWVIATYQSVVMYDWLPKYMRKETAVYEGYNPNVDPQVSHVFQSAAMRFGHTLVTSGVYLRKRSDKQCEPTFFNLDSGGSKKIRGVRTCNSFWRSPELFTSAGGTENFENFLMGLSSQSSEREDHIIVKDLRGRVFGPLEFSRRDLMAINIQRGRDHGLPDYNTARKHFLLPTLDSLDLGEYKSKTGTEVNDEIIRQLKSLYKDPNEVDIWPGGLLETTNGPGQLFSRVILDQFQRVRDGDRFWFENSKTELFTEKERYRIRQIKVIDILLAVTNLVPGEDIQDDPFTAVHGKENSISQNCLNELTQNEPCKLINGSDTTCRYLPQLNDVNAELCTPLKTYDYFSGSAVSYIISFAVLLAVCAGITLQIIIQSKTKAMESTKKKFQTIKVTENTHKAKERVASRETRYVIVVLDAKSKRIQVKDTRGSLLRTIDFTHVKEVTIKHMPDFTKMLLSITHHYDLFMMFQDAFNAEKLKMDIQNFCDTIGVKYTYIPESEAKLSRNQLTVYMREKRLAEFSRLVLSNAFSDSKLASITEDILSRYHGKRDILSMEITQIELAQQLGMLPDSIFVEQMFQLMDHNRNGFITIKEFWDIMVVFAQGTRDEKSQLMFKIYDLSHTGSISSSDLISIVKSTLGTEGKNRDLDKVVQTMMQSVGLQEGQSIDFQKFKQLFNDEGGVFQNVGLDLKANLSKRKESCFSLYGDIPTGGFAAEAARKEYDEAREDTLTQEEKEEKPSISNPIMEMFRSLSNKIRSKEQYVFWSSLYTTVMFLIFFERAYYYTIEREHSGLRRIAGLGVTVTRGAASAMMFTYSTLLVTMCRNLLSQLRSTSIHRFFPFDDMVSFHRYVGHWALLWTVMHVIGHAINFYHIATQTPSDLICIFRDYFRSSDTLPKFHYWCWGTITGLTGVALTIQTAIIYAYAYFSRRYFFKYFWWTHNTYPVFYILMILHGSGRLVQAPFFHFFFLGPCILFTIDKIISMSRNRIRIDIKDATHLPSNVIKLTIRRPPDFNFQSGQWVRIASLGISDLEYHPFTLSSSPNEDDLTLHIRAVGPWTHKLRSVYPDQSMKQKNDRYPQIYMDGPFGEGHQMWWNFELVIFVAGGIGVTPFASILKDIAHHLKSSKTLLKTKKVIFLWVTKSQKQFEWLTEVLRGVEAADTKNIIRTHIFITQFKSKYDLRTIMLYLAERHFQKLSGTSLFTGLRAITHFGRPDFTSVFKSIKKRYNSGEDKVSVVGVFTCGNPSLSSAVDQGCQTLNKEESPVFKHYYENF